MKTFTASSVLNNTPEKLISRVLDCFDREGICEKVYVIDNSPCQSHYDFTKHKNIKYIKNLSNAGYGAGHNLALIQTIDFADYHFVVNPDIFFKAGSLKKMIQRVSQDRGIGLLMPKVLYPDEQLQYLCKLLPTPADLIFRRFLPGFLSKFNSISNSLYELRFTGYDIEMNVPSLSGCFMLLSSDALKKVGLFDERYFMYAEDLDLSRRIHSHFVTLFYPNAEIIHDHAKDSYKNMRMLILHISSIFKYFNKWGWLFDKKRVEVNKRALVKLKLDFD
jgi:GT2 family glycosyltransferase